MSCELDVLPTHIHKEMLDHLLPTITKIINMSLTQGIFIDKWKNALVRPLLKKKGMELILKSYWPVSNLSFLSKVVERAALDQINNHCEPHNIILDYQLAYRANYSCKIVLVKLVNNGLWCYKNQEAMQIIAIDLSAAFDMVDHYLLLSVLQKSIGNCDVMPRLLKCNLLWSTRQGYGKPPKNPKCTCQISTTEG